jgi:sortase A
MIRIPAIHIDQVVVQGTAHGDLEKGPGHYTNTAWPGQGKTIAIAGHRTTWGAPFHDLNYLHRNELISFCGVSYKIQAIVVVPANDWRIIFAHRPTETLILSSCYPLYSASHRIVVISRRI